MGRDDMREVSFVEGDGTGDPPLHGERAARPVPPARRRDRRAADPPPPSVTGHRWTRRGWPGASPHGRPGRRRRTVAAALAVLVVLAVVAGVSAVRTRAHAARLAALPGVLAPVDRTVEPRWRWPSARLVGTTRDDDLLLLAPPAGGGERGVAAVDVTDGRERWRAPLPGLDDTADVSCVALDGAGTTAPVACRVVTAVVVADGGARQPRPGARSSLLVLDGATGARLAERDLGGRWVEITSLGGDLVLAECSADRHVRVVREDALTGRTAWTTDSAWRVQDAGGFRPHPPVPSIEDGTIVVEGSVALALSPDGALLGEWHLSRTYGGPNARTVRLRPLPGDRFAVWEPMAAPPTGALTSTGGGREVWFLGSALEPVVDDGSGPDHGLLTLTGADLLALDAGTGRLLWRAQEDFRPGDVVLLGGRVITMAREGLTAVDARTGRTLWQAGVRVPGVEQPLLTDGRVLLIPTDDADRGPLLVALGPDDGRERWSVPVPDGVVGAHVVGGRLVLRTGDALIGLG